MEDNFKKSDRVYLNEKESKHPNSFIAWQVKKIENPHIDFLKNTLTIHDCGCIVDIDFSFKNDSTYVNALRKLGLLKKQIREFEKSLLEVGNKYIESKAGVNYHIS